MPLFWKSQRVMQGNYLKILRIPTIFDAILLLGILS